MNKGIYQGEDFNLDLDIFDLELRQPLDISERFPTSLTFTATGGTKSITIDTNESWIIS